MALVSIIVPTYNRAYCIARALDSACAQTHRDVEVIVIDDGSTDGTDTFVRGRYASDPRVRYFRQQNGGVCKARNSGLRQMRGDFVALLDSDDEWLPWKIEMELRCLEAFPRAGMVWTDMSAIGPDGATAAAGYLRTMYSCWGHYPDPGQIFAESRFLRDIAPALAAEVGDASVYTGDAFSPMIRGNLVHTSTVLLRRERFERVKEFNEALTPSGEDFDFHLRTCHAGPVAFADIPTIRYQVGMPDRLTRPELHMAMAQNFFRTIDPFVRLHRDDIHLSDAVIDGVLAEAHAWIGEEHLWRLEMADARRHLARSLRYQVTQVRPWKLLAASFLPASVVAAKRDGGAKR